MLLAVVMMVLMNDVCGCSAVVVVIVNGGIGCGGGCCGVSIPWLFNFMSLRPLVGCLCIMHA
jgi:hypothetical protein